MVKLCSGIRSNNLKCKNKIQQTQSYCRFHKPISRIVKQPQSKPNDKLNKFIKGFVQDIINSSIYPECTVCLDLVLPNENVTPCHKIHIRCVIKSGKAECPMCRGNLQLSKNQMKKMLVYKNKYNAEFEADSIEEFMDTEESVDTYDPLIQILIQHHIHIIAELVKKLFKRIIDDPRILTLEEFTNIHVNFFIQQISRLLIISLEQEMVNEIDIFCGFDRRCNSSELRCIIGYILEKPMISLHDIYMARFPNMKSRYIETLLYYIIEG